MVLALQKLIFGRLIGLLIGHHHIQIMNHRGVDGGHVCLRQAVVKRDQPSQFMDLWDRLALLVELLPLLGRVAREHFQ